MHFINFIDSAATEDMATSRKRSRSPEIETAEIGYDTVIYSSLTVVHINDTCSF